jgi:hypothetical protein
VAETLIFDKLSEERSDVDECNTASRWGWENTKVYLQKTVDSEKRKR